MTARVAVWAVAGVCAAPLAFAEANPTRMSFANGATAPVAVLFAQSGTSATETPGLKPGEVAVVGCLMREADYRAIMAKDKGGVLGTGIGVSNEYVLVDVTAAPASATARDTAMAAKLAQSYSLTGKLEDNLVRQVGRMVQIVGMPAAMTDKDRLPELTVTLAHPVGDFCPVKK